MTTRATRSRKAPPTPADLKLSPEVAWYLEDRGWPLPTCVPKFKTPEPRKLRGAQFDPERVDRVVAALERMQHTQGEWAGRPLRPDPWQVAYMLAPVYGWVRKNDRGMWVRVARTEYVEVPRKNGKGLALDTPILTERGWRQFGDLAEGDRVHAVDGSLTSVTFVSPVRDLDCFEVTFSDGQTIVADADHLWTVRDWTVRDRYRARTVTVDTATMATNFLVGSRPTHRERRYSLSLPAPIDRADADLPLDPYLLGAWLGDGESLGARMTGVDAGVIGAFWSAGFVPGAVSGGITTNVKGLRPVLRDLGVFGNKHVPESYLLGSEKQRLALLQGLMDTDGGVIRSGRPSSARCEFTSTREVLAEAALFLARSLGWKATVRPGRATINGRDCGPKWRVSWTAYRDETPFRLERKTDLLPVRPDRPQRSRTLQVANVQRVPSVPTKCIQVAHPSALFLAGRGLVPTHNTTVAGGQALYLTGADGEAGAQVLAAAAGKDQASFCFTPVKALADGSPALKNHFQTRQGKVLHPKSGSYFMVVSSIADLLHGANVHGAVIDELHIHKTRDLVDAIETGTGARSQPLVVIITTSDDGRQGTIYAEKRTYCEQLASGIITDPTFYGVIWGADETDDLFDEATWVKANPGYGISPTREFMQAEARKAQQSPANRARFLRLHLGLRTKQETKYLDLGSWDANASMVDEADLAGRDCYGGLDLASTSDLCALAWDFPDSEGRHAVLWRHWCPEAAFERLNVRTAGQAAVWRRDGWLTVTPGNVADYDYIRAQINADRERFRARSIGFDPWNSSQLVNDLMADEAPMVTVRQGFGSMSAPTKELQRVVLEGDGGEPRYRHGGNPLVRWQVDNFAVEMDPAGNVKPSKRHAGDKIDGLVAGIIALDGATRAAPARMPPAAPRRAAGSPSDLTTVGF